MKRNKLVYASILLATALTGCVNPGELSSLGTSEANDYVQGVTDTTIYIGNTAATSGAFATVGVPFNAGLEAALKVYNDAGGFGEKGLKVELKHYDDGFDGSVGLAKTEQLVEEDEVFALVGHFGTNTVEATLDYIKEKGVPMVYAAIGVSGLYNLEAKGNERAVMSVQPIYDAEGQVLLARALATTEGALGLGGSKIGVISTTDDAGKGMLNGIKVEAEKLGSKITTPITYVETSATQGTNHANAVATLKAAGCDVVIIAANQTPFEEIMGYFNTSGYDNVKVITSYVSANATLAGKMVGNGSVTATREAYTTAWLDITDATYLYAPEASNVVGTTLWACYKALVADTPYATMYDAGVPGFSKDYWEAAEAIFGYGLATLTGEDALVTAYGYSYNSYALAGYIAGATFLEGLERVEEANKELTWANYIDEMEDGEIDIPMGGAINLANGYRAGIQDLALNKFGTNAYTGAGELQVYSGITSLASVEAGI